MNIIEELMRQSVAASKVNIDHSRGIDGTLLSRRQREYMNKSIYISAPAIVATSIPIIPGTGLFTFGTSTFGSTDLIG